MCACTLQTQGQAHLLCRGVVNRDLDVHKLQTEVGRVTGVGVGLHGTEEVEVVIEGVLHQPAVEVVRPGQKLATVVNEGNVAPCQGYCLLHESKERRKVQVVCETVHCMLQART